MLAALFTLQGCADVLQKFKRDVRFQTRQLLYMKDAQRRYAAQVTAYLQHPFGFTSLFTPWLPVLWQAVTHV
jgi:hypothetical protein